MSTDTLSFLEPCSSTHSIAEAILTFHLVAKIENPKEFLSKFKEKFTDFTESGLTLTHGIQIKLEKEYLPKIESNDPQIDGFFAKKYREDKKQSIVIQNMSVMPANIPLLSIHFLDYTKWDNFIQDVKEITRKLSEINLFLIKAVGLLYVDSFDWKSKSPPPLRNIFNNSSNYLPNNFFSYEGEFQIMNSGIVKRKSEQEYVERIEINYRQHSEDLSKLQLHHNVTFDLKGQIILNELFKESEQGIDSFDEILDYEHSLNKRFVCDLFTSEVKNKINLKCIDYVE